MEPRRGIAVYYTATFPKNAGDSQILKQYKNLQQGKRFTV